MPQYVILAEHPPNICSSSNARSRARAIEGLGQDLPRLSEEAAVTFVAGPLHLDPGHAPSRSSSRRASRRGPTRLRHWPVPVEHRRSLPQRARRRAHGQPRRFPHRLRVAAASPATPGRDSGHLLERPLDLDVARDAAHAQVDPRVAAPRPGCGASQRDVRAHFARHRLDVDVQVDAGWPRRPTRCPTPSARGACPRRGRGPGRRPTRWSPGPRGPARRGGRPRRRLDLDLAGRRPHLEVTRRRGEDGPPATLEQRRSPEAVWTRRSPPTAPTVKSPLADLAEVRGHVVGRDVAAPRR